MDKLTECRDETHGTTSQGTQHTFRVIETRFHRNTLRQRINVSDQKSCVKFRWNAVKILVHIVTHSLTRAFHGNRRRRSSSTTTPLSKLKSSHTRKSSTLNKNESRLGASHAFMPCSCCSPELSSNVFVAVIHQLGWQFSCESNAHKNGMHIYTYILKITHTSGAHKRCSLILY